jgi:hypothetical protein
LIMCEDLQITNQVLPHLRKVRPADGAEHGGVYWLLDPRSGGRFSEGSMNMATKVVMVQKLGTPDEIKFCINHKGQCRDGKVAVGSVSLDVIAFPCVPCTKC